MLLFSILAVLLFGMTIYRRALRLSTEGDYPVWSLTTLHEMSTYLVFSGVAGLLIIAWVVVGWLQDRRREAGRDGDHEDSQGSSTKASGK
jgi:hypothetical protein